MLGTVPAPGDLSTEDLSTYLTRKEQSNFAQLTALTADPAAGSNRNLATYIDQQQDQLGALLVCAKGASSQGTKILSTAAYISGTKTEIDVYRLPLS